LASIRTAGLTKDFGDLRAVNEIDLDLPEGGVAGFVGPNGAGKSTTIRMLLGLITPTGGEGEVFGHPIGRPAAYLHRVGALIEIALGWKVYSLSRGPVDSIGDRGRAVLFGDVNVEQQSARASEAARVTDFTEETK
jgi:ABC-type glutathione transport system ATPase component